MFDDGSTERFERGRWVELWQQGLPMAVLHADRCSVMWRRGLAAAGAAAGFDEVG